MHGKIFYAAGGTLALACSGVAMAVPSSAAEVTDVISAVSVSPRLETPFGQDGNAEAVPTGAVVDVKVAFVAPEGAADGDTATLQLPDELTVANPISFEIATDDGAGPAGVVASGQSGDSVVMTFSPYVETHEKVSGEVVFQAVFNSSSASASPTSIPLTFTSGAEVFDASVQGYKYPESGVGPTLSTVGGVVSGDTLTWTYSAGHDIQGLVPTIALMDGATAVDCSNVQVTYRDTPWDGGEFPVGATFSESTPAPASCVSSTFGEFGAATQVIAISSDATGIPSGVLREYQIVTSITDPRAVAFQSVLGVTDPASSATIYAPGLAARSLPMGTATGQPLAAPTDNPTTPGSTPAGPTETPDTVPTTSVDQNGAVESAAAGSTVTSTGQLAETGLDSSRLLGLGLVAAALVSVGLGTMIVRRRHA